MMYCRKCGTKIKETAQFCENCGAEVILVKQRSYTEKYKEDKKKEKATQQNMSKKQKEMRQKHDDIQNPYISACLIAACVSLALAIFPWNLIGKGIGTSLAMRIAVVVFALLGDYHATKAKQTNLYIKQRYGFELQPSTVKLGNALSIFATIMGLFALFTYGG